jgi:hypothetical protein
LLARKALLILEPYCAFPSDDAQLVEIRFNLIKRQITMTLSSVLRTKDKIGYGLGDMASALVWQTATLFLAYFIRMFLVCPPQLWAPCF